MALEHLTDWGSRVERPWGYEVRVVFRDSGTTQTHEEVFVVALAKGQKVSDLDEKLIAARIVAAQEALAARLAVPVVPVLSEVEMVRAEKAVVEGKLQAMAAQRDALVAGKALQPETETPVDPVVEG
jgi:hypothetical protein